MAHPAPIDLPTRRETLFDPPSALGHLRAHHPLCRLRHRSGEVGWLVTSLALAREVLTDRRFGLAEPRPFPVQDPARHAAIVETPARVGATGGDLLAMDAPDHTRLRRVLAGQFSIRRVSALRPRVTQIVDERLDAMEQEGPPADLVACFAEPVALATHCALLGVPIADSVHLERLSRTAADPGSTPDAIAAAIVQVRDYVLELIARRRVEPGDDLVSHLVAGGELREHEIVSLLILLFNAGVDTVAIMLATGPFALLCHPEQLAALRADPALVDDAVEELMRYLSIFHVGSLTRTAYEDVELAGVRIRAGERLTVSFAAANRDPDRFPAADRLDVRRAARGHLGFGHGVHVCLGQHLARLEMQVGLTRLLARFPALALAVAPDEVPLSTEEHLIFGARELPVTW